MAFNIGQFLGNVGTSLGASSNSYLSGLGGIAGFASSFVPQPSARPMMLPSYPVGGPGAPMTVSNVPAVRVGTALTKEIFDAGVKVLSRLGLMVPASSGRFTSVLKRTLGSMASLARRTPAGTIVSLLAGIGLTTYESNLLVAWHSQRKRGRRMNPCNSKALRRAGRRIKSFHKLCQVLDTKRTVHHRFQKKCA